MKQIQDKLQCIGFLDEVVTQFRTTFDKTTFKIAHQDSTPNLKREISPFQSLHEPMSTTVVISHAKSPVKVDYSYSN